MKKTLPALALAAFPVIANADFAAAFEMGGHGMFGTTLEWTLTGTGRLTGGHALSFDLTGVVTPGKTSVMEMSWLNYTWLRGGDRHWFEASLGPTYAALKQSERFGDDERRSRAWLLNSNLGYRYESGRLQFRAGVTLHAELGDANDDGEGATAAIPYISAGLRF